MSDRPPQGDKVHFSLWGVMVVVTIASICCALIPGAALFVVGLTPMALGFIVFVIADQRNHESYRILGLVLIAIGIGVGGPLMVLVSGL